MRKIQFGSGGHILKGFINVDLDKSQGADVAWNMEKTPYPFKDNSADYILCEMTLEHIRTPSKAINEFHRIIKPSGTVRIIVPHFSHAYSLNADIHITNFTVGYFWDRRCDDSISKKDLFNRKVSKNRWKVIENKKYWKDIEVKLIFPKGFLIILSLPWQIIFGKNKVMQGIYENFFQHIL